MNKEFTDDYRDVCRLLLAARSLQDMETAAFYAVAMCDQLGFDADGLEMKDGLLSNVLPLHLEALWLGFADAMRASAVRIDSWRIFTVRNGRGRLLAVKLLDAAEIKTYQPVPLETDYHRQLARIDEHHRAVADFARRQSRAL